MNCARLGLFCLLVVLLLATANVQAQTPKSVAKDLGVSEESVKRMMLVRSMSAKTLSEVPKAKLPGLMRRIDHPNLQRERSEARMLSYRDEHGRGFDPMLVVKSANHMKALTTRSPKGLTAGMPTGPINAKSLLPLNENIVKGQWTWMGPGRVGGRTRTLVFHPDNPDHMYAGSVTGGIWRSINGGEAWYPVDAFMSNLCITSLMFDPSNVNVMYAGTGESFGNGDSLRGGGIFKSTDRGNSWTQLAATANENFYYVNRLAISPAGNVILAATPRGIYRSIDKGESWFPMMFDAVADVKFHPTDNRKAIAGALYSGDVWTTEDAGINWRLAVFTEDSSSRVELTYAKADTNVVYASSNTNRGTIFRSVDGGRNFTKVNELKHLGGQGIYDNAIWAGHPTNANLVLTGGIDMFRSFDGGQTFSRASQWSTPASIHADHHYIIEHPDFGDQLSPNRSTVYFCCDGGIYRARDVTTVGNDAFSGHANGWEAINNNYGVTQFTALAVTKNGKIIAGAQDNGTLVYSPSRGTHNWHKPGGAAGGDGGTCAADPDDENYLYGEYINLMMHRSSNGGQSFDTICGNHWNGVVGRWEWKNPPYVIEDARDKKALFYAPFVLDPKSSQRILAGGDSLWRTNDAKAQLTSTTGPQWQKIKNPHLRGGAPTKISAIAIDPNSSDTVYVAHTDGRIFKSTNATQPRPTWQMMDTQRSDLPRRFCHSITVDPKNSRTLYASFGTYSTQNLWKSRDGGATWFDASAGMPASPVRTVAVHPQNSNWVYIGTELGVFTSSDGAATWWPISTGPINVSVEQFVWRGNILYAATYGRGVYAIDLSF